MNVVAGALQTVSKSSSPVAVAARTLVQAITRKNASRVLLIYILSILYKYRTTSYGTKPRTDLKGPRGWPLVGNMVLMLMTPRNQISQLNVTLHEQYGTTWAFTVPKLGRVVQFSDPEVLEHVLKGNFWAYEKGPLLQETFNDLLGVGIFAVDGHVFVRESNIVIDYLYKMADQNKPVDLQEIFYKFTLDSFGEVSFGQSFGCLTNPEKEVEFASAFDRLNTTVFNRLFEGSWEIREWTSGTKKIVAKDKKLIQDFALNIIRARRENGYHKPQKDLLQLFMDMEGDDGKPLSDDMLKDLILNFIIAGRDTTAQAMSWMFYLLHRSQTDTATLPKLVQEIDQVLQGQDPSYETTKKMKYSEACMYEALRLYPSVPRNLKVCVQDDVWPDGTKVYKGEFVSWSSWAMGRSTAIWGPDASDYVPDRWLNTDKPSPANLARLGQQFATIEALTIMGMLFSRFEFELVDPHTEPGYSPSLTLPLSKGLPIHVKRRQQAAVAV
ncbi:hypothetical protein BG004_005877 [Podila humilis]|nr:hypothetical protein BG004_005877 [Podila humilis]